ncbi:TetR/AcrR family transcriptional regulator [Sorangium sp. So ce131]|uniref:TetR/AcrR family transcriptional regulator n=1 Tax=Sorangium sp. So ce131 TaxID=3133282 RepID=UPI003F5F58BC
MVLTPKQRAKRPYHHGDLRRALLDATLGLIAEGDVAGVSLREAARRAGVTYGAPYHHFQDKAELLAAVAEEGFRKLLDVVTAAAAGDLSPEARVAAWGAAHMRFATAQAAHYRVMFLTEIGDRERFRSLHDVAGELLAALAALIGAARPEALSQRRLELAVMAWSAWHGLASLHNEHVIENRPELPGLDRLVAVLSRDVARAICQRDTGAA